MLRLAACGIPHCDHFVALSKPHTPGCFHPGKCLEPLQASCVILNSERVSNMSGTTLRGCMQYSFQAWKRNCKNTTSQHVKTSTRQHVNTSQAISLASPQPMTNLESPQLSLLSAPKLTEALRSLLLSRSKSHKEANRKQTGSNVNSRIVAISLGETAKRTKRAKSEWGPRKQSVWSSWALGPRSMIRSKCSEARIKPNITLASTIRFIRYYTKLCKYECTSNSHAERGLECSVSSVFCFYSVSIFISIFIRYIVLFCFFFKCPKHCRSTRLLICAPPLPPRQQSPEMSQKRSQKWLDKARGFRLGWSTWWSPDGPVMSSMVLYDRSDGSWLTSDNLQWWTDSSISSRRFCIDTHLQTWHSEHRTQRSPRPASIVEPQMPDIPSFIECYVATPNGRAT